MRRASRRSGSVSPWRWYRRRRRTSPRPVRRVGQVLVILSRSALCTSAARSRPTCSAPSCSAGASPPPCTSRSAHPTPADARPGGVGVAALRRRGRRPRACAGPACGAGDLRRTRARPGVRVTALGRDEADAQLLARGWRFLAYRDTAPNLFPTRRQQVEYEAYVELLARDRGVAAPRVIVAGATRELALLAEEMPEGSLLSARGPATVTEPLLRSDLGAGRALRGSAHRTRRARCRPRGRRRSQPRPRSSASRRRRRAPSSSSWPVTSPSCSGPTATVVEPERAVRIARGVVGDDALRDAAPIRASPGDDPAGPATRSAAHGLDDAAELREATRHSAARRTPRAAPALSRASTHRSSWRSRRCSRWASCSAGSGIRPSSGRRSATRAGSTSGSRSCSACSPTWRSRWRSSAPSRFECPCGPILLQSSMSFSNLAVPVAADAAMQVRFLQRHGLDLTSAVATGGVLSTVSELAVQIGLLPRAVARARRDRLRQHRHRPARHLRADRGVRRGRRDRGRVQHPEHPAGGRSGGHARRRGPCGRR